ncbi:putative nuclease HARBI1 [Zophobas morio]|uniref:putative nuclease HARBI1 n=1 Tax=Zophobas morio TaxID=2755281 RepID=UPI0030831E84
MAQFMLPIRRRKIYKARRQAGASTYKAMYRFEEDNVEYLADVFLGENYERRGGALTPKQKIQIFLRYVGDPGFQVGVGEDSGTHQSSVSRNVKFVSEKIYEKVNQWIQFPAEQAEIDAARHQWQEAFNFPFVIGALDCTQIKIKKPLEHGDEYICRKQFASINVQATCNSREWFTSVDATWPGSVHDSRIWRNSSVLPIISRYQGQAILLGDSGYAVAPWLITPYRNPRNQVEIHFNNMHKRNRVIIERCFGQVKKRFPILMNDIRVRLSRIPKLIVSCFVLHNVSKFVNDVNDFPDIPLEEDDEIVEHENHNPIQGIQRRNELAQILYAQR